MVSLVFLLLVSMVVAGHVPVVIMHGINSSAEYWEQFYKPWLEADFPDMYVRCLDVGDGAKDSIFYNFDAYVDAVAEQIAADPNLANGFTFIGHSQGGIVARSYIERYNNPPVLQFLSLSSPHGGFICGEDDCYIDLGEYTYIVDYFASDMLYTDYFQDNLMPAAYWRDPNQLEKYREECRVLPKINNEVEFNQKYKDNFMSLKRVALVGSSNDEVITPYRSAWFEFYKDNSISEITPLEESDIWINDRIGLKALYEQGKLEFINSYLSHSQYRYDEKFYNTYVKEFVDVKYEDY